MKYLIFILGILLLSAFAQCGRESTHSFFCDDCETIPIDPNSVRKQFPLENILGKVAYIPIETRDSFLIGKIDKFIALDGKFILLDRSRTHSIFIVDSLGKQVSLIHKVGAGPGEYIDPKSVAVNPFNNEIDVLCDRTQKVLSYDFEGNFKSEKKIDIYSSQVDVVAKDRYIFYTNFKPNSPAYRVGTSFPNLALTNHQGKLLESADYYSANISTRHLWGMGKIFSRPYPDTVSINPDHSNIAYYITRNSIFPRYAFDFGKYNINEEYFKEVLDGNKSIKNKFADLSAKYCMISKYLEGQKYIYLSYSYQEQSISVLYSKETKKLYQFYGLHDDEIIPLYNPVYILGNKLYYLMEPSIFLKMMEKKAAVDSDLQKITQKISATDNPIIIEATLRDF